MQRLHESPLSLTPERTSRRSPHSFAPPESPAIFPDEMALSLTKTNAATERTISAFEEFFKGTSTQRRVISFLPSLPLPLELTYAMLERYPPPPAAKP